MDQIRYISLDAATPIALIIEQHKRIVDGIEAGDPTIAAAAMRSHLREITLSSPTSPGVSQRCSRESNQAVPVARPASSGCNFKVKAQTTFTMAAYNLTRWRRSLVGD